MINSPRVLMLQQRDWALHIGHNIAKELQGQGYRLTAITLKKSVDQFVRSQTEVNYEQIVSHDDFWGDPHSVPGVEGLSLTEVCDDLGVDSIWPIAATERHYVKDYSKGYFYSFGQYRSDQDIEAYIKATYIKIRDLLDAYPPDLIVGANFVAAYQLIAYKLAAKRQIPMIGMAPARIAGRYIFVTDPNYRTGRFFDHLNSLVAEDIPIENAELARKYISDFRLKYRRPPEEERLMPGAIKKSLKRRIKDALRPWWHAAKSLRGGKIDQVPNLGPTPDSPSWRIILRDHYSEKKNRRDLGRLKFHSLDDIREFAYYALQAQPEVQIDTMSPYVSNQIETARLIAQSLPGDMTLVVKEHPYMVGKRPRSYYQKLIRTPNVKFVDPETPILELLTKAKCVVGSGGTTMLEAAFYHVPAIQFGDLGLIRSLPNVIPHSDFTTLSRKIKDVVATELGGANYERGLENYVSAALSIGFEVDYLGAKWGNQESLRMMVDNYMTEIATILQSNLISESDTKHSPVYG